MIYLKSNLMLFFVGSTNIGLIVSPFIYNHLIKKKDFIFDLNYELSEII